MGSAAATSRRWVGRKACAIVVVAASLVVWGSLLLEAPRADAYIFWSNYTGDSISRANMDGTGVQHNLFDANDAYGLGASSDAIYWADYGTNSIGRANLDGSDPDPEFITSAGYPTAVATQGQFLYWSQFGFDRIGRSDLDGENINDAFVPNADDPYGIAANASHLYWANSSGDSIGRSNLNGAAVNQYLVENAGFPTGMTVSGSHIYWATGNNVARAGLDGSDKNLSFIDVADSAQGVSTAQGKVLWTNFGDNSIGRANVDGSDVEAAFITDASGPYGIVAAPLPNQVQVKSVKLKRKRGTARMRVELPGAGTLRLKSSPKLKGVKPVIATAPNTVALTIATRGAAKTKLRKNGRLRITAKLTFAPVDKGSAGSKSRGITLKRS